MAEGGSSSSIVIVIVLFLLLSSSTAKPGTLPYGVPGMPGATTYPPGVYPPGYPPQYAPPPASTSAAGSFLNFLTAPTPAQAPPPSGSVYYVPQTYTAKPGLPPASSTGYVDPNTGLYYATSGSTGVPVAPANYAPGSYAPNYNAATGTYAAYAPGASSPGPYAPAATTVPGSGDSLLPLADASTSPDATTSDSVYA
jgi:hypothetical protein